MSAYVRFSPHFVNQKPSWYLYSLLFSVPPVSGFLWASHTYLLKDYKNLVSYCQNGKPVEVPEDLKKTFEEVKQDLPMKNFYKKFISVFMVNGFDPFYAGSTRQLHGAIVGFPKVFTYKSVEDARKDAEEIRIQESPVLWEHVEPEVRNKFFNSLVLSEKAKKYAIAYNCLLVDSMAFAAYPIYPLIIGVFNGIMGESFSRKFELRKKPFIYSIGLAVVIVSTSICAWISIIDLQKFSLEKSANSSINEMSDEYIEGAIEYWTKLTERNIALRSLMKGGDSRFSTLGKESFILGSAGIAPIDQKLYYEDLLQKRKAAKAAKAEAERAVAAEGEAVKSEAA